MYSGVVYESFTLHILE